MVALTYGSHTVDCEDSETVLDALLRNRIEVPYSCKQGVCLSCLMKAETGSPPAAAQKGLKDTLREQNYFLPCLCLASEDMRLAMAGTEAGYGDASIVAVERLSAHVVRLLVQPETHLTYRAGQFINLRRYDGLTRTYSIASLSQSGKPLELHIKRMTGGKMSNWIESALIPGDTVQIKGPNGECFYTEGNADQPLLLIGNGTGLAPLYGIVRDALDRGHRGPIHLYHGSRYFQGLYLHQRLAALAKRYRNLNYHPCLSGSRVPQGCRAGRAENIALHDFPDLSGWRVFLCGCPPMVHGAKKRAYLAGARMSDIHADAFELRELRRHPRPDQQEAVA